jgi:hypothetical protein
LWHIWHTTHHSGSHQHPEQGLPLVDEEFLSLPTEHQSFFIFDVQPCSSVSNNTFCSLEIISE